MFEHFELYMKHYSNNHCQFSTFKHNAVKQAEIRSEKVPLSEFFPQAHEAHGLPVIKCSNVVRSIQEDTAKIFTIKFVNQSGKERLITRTYQICKLFEACNGKSQNQLLTSSE